MGLISRTLGGAVGSCEVVGVRVGLLHAAACSTLGDGLVVGTLGSGSAVICGRSTLGDGVTVVGGAGIFCWSDGTRILCSCWMAWDCAMDSLVEDGTVPPRAVSVSVTWMIVRSVPEIFGMAQCVG